MVMKRVKGSLMIPPSLSRKKENDRQRQLRATPKEAEKQSQHQDLNSLPDQEPLLNPAKRRKNPTLPHQLLFYPPILSPRNYYPQILSKELYGCFTLVRHPKAYLVAKKNLSTSSAKLKKV